MRNDISDSLGKDKAETAVRHRNKQRKKEAELVAGFTIRLQIKKLADTP